MSSSLLDASPFLTGDPSQQAHFALKFHELLSEHGFVRLYNHGVEEYMIQEAFNWNKKFSALTFEEKANVANFPGPHPQRGWSSLGIERSASLYKKGFLGADENNDLLDSREHFDIGSINDEEFPNKWPAEEILPGFRSFMEAFYKTLEDASHWILKALEMAFKVPEGTLTEKCFGGFNASELRFNHYPAVTAESLSGAKLRRIWPHFDLGVITLLFQDAVGGLEFEDRSHPGTFKPLMPQLSTELVVNVSETLQRWTNDQLKAGLHTVNIPQQFKSSAITIPERFSVAFFCKADRLTSVGPISDFTVTGEEAKYDDITALEYHQRRLASAY